MEQLSQHVNSRTILHLVSQNLFNKFLFPVKGEIMSMPCATIDLVLWLAVLVLRTFDDQTCSSAREAHYLQPHVTSSPQARASDSAAGSARNSPTDEIDTAKAGQHSAA